MENNALIRTLETSLTASSLRDLVRSQTDNPMLLIDCSGSMCTGLGDGTGRSCIDALKEVVTAIKAEGPVTMIAFGSDEVNEPRFVDNVPTAGGGTPLHAAIRMGKAYGATRLVVVSDGLPDLVEESLNAAREFGGQIDVCYVGRPGDGGSQFLDELARLTGGTRFEGSLAETKLLTGKIIALLEGPTEERAPIVGEGFSAAESEEPEADDDDSDDDDSDDDEDEDEDDD